MSNYDNSGKNYYSYFLRGVENMARISKKIDESVVEIVLSSDLLKVRGFQSIDVVFVIGKNYRIFVIFPSLIC